MTQPSTPSSAAPAQPPATPPAAAVTPPASPKLEFADGKVLVDGKKYVSESDLIAAKESLQAKLDETARLHTGEVDKVRLELSAAQQDLAKATAALQEATVARTSGAASTDDVARAKKEAEEAKVALGKLQESALDTRRKLIMVTYKIPADSDTGKGLATKTSAQLDSFEEALKALAGSRGGLGNYAVGGGSSSNGAMSHLDRAKAMIASTPYRGVRNEPPNKQ